MENGELMNGDVGKKIYKNEFKNEHNDVYNTKKTIQTINMNESLNNANENVLLLNAELSKIGPNIAVSYNTENGTYDLSYGTVTTNGIKWVHRITDFSIHGELTALNVKETIRDMMLSDGVSGFGEFFVFVLKPSMMTNGSDMQKISFSETEKKFNVQPITEEETNRLVLELITLFE